MNSNVEQFFGSGVFASVPEAFPGTDPGVLQAVKLHFFTQLTEGVLRPQALVSTDRLLVDIGAVNANSFNVQKLIKDCELVAQAAGKKPQHFQEILRIMGATAKDRTTGPLHKLDVPRAVQLVEELGLTETSAARAGGGIFMLIIAIALVVAAAGCQHCAPYQKP